MIPDPAMGKQPVIVGVWRLGHLYASAVLPESQAVRVDGDQAAPRQLRSQSRLPGPRVTGNQVDRHRFILPADGRSIASPGETAFAEARVGLQQRELLTAGPACGPGTASRIRRSARQASRVSVTAGVAPNEASGGCGYQVVRLAAQVGPRPVRSACW